MSFENVYQRKIMKGNNSEEDQWVPETPAKVNVVQKTWSDEFSSRSESDYKDLHHFNTSADHDAIEEFHCDNKIPDDNVCPCNDFGIQTPVQKRKKETTDANGRPRKKPKKKVYWPKVVGQSKRTKRAAEPKPKRVSKEAGAAKPKRSPKLKTQKPSNNLENIPIPCMPFPKQKRSKVRSRTTLCKRSLFDSERISTAIETVSSFYLLEYQQLNQSLSRKSVANESGFKYNSLQAYQKRFEPICSNVCKKKRTARKRKRLPPRLDVCLNFCIKGIWSIRKKKRSKGCTTGRRDYSLAWATIPMFNQAPISSCRSELVPKAVESLPKELVANQIVAKVNLDEPDANKVVPSNQIVPFKIKIKLDQPAANQLLLYKAKKPRVGPVMKVNIDEESVRVWKLLQHGKADEEMDPKKQKYWEQERNLFRGRVETFISRMHLIQGNRRFRPWKGSVLDSVIGVFLTQNVSDHLSSSAYMSLAARFPVVQTTSNSNENKETREVSDEKKEVTLVQEFGSDCVSDKKKESPCTHETDEKKETIPGEESESNNVSDEKNKSSRIKAEKLSDNIHDHMKIVKNNQSRKPDSPGIIFGKKKSAIPKKTVSEEEKLDIEREQQYWEVLRKMYSKNGARHSDHTDSVNWEAVLQAGKEALADAIACRGQHRVIAERILALLNKLKEMHENIDIEWLRYAPPQKVKEYLLKVYGLGLKSVECIRLLTLRHVAFPVDVNVARITTRLGWIPLEPLPGNLHLHLLDQYPMMDVVQQYLWPRLCNLDQPTLYQLHYQLITFGKVFCTKTKPNCNACPMKADCRHFASASASRANLALPAGTASNERPTDKCIVGAATNFVPADSILLSNVRSISTSEENESFQAQYQAKECEPIIEMPPSPEPETRKWIDEIDNDIEDFGEVFGARYQRLLPRGQLQWAEVRRRAFREEIPANELISKECMEEPNDRLDEGDVSKSRALVLLTMHQASNPPPKLKDVGRLQTRRLAYEIPNTSSLLEGFEKPENHDDPFKYLFVMWKTDEIKDLNEEVCNDNENTVLGTILIPCRTAMRGRFPLNGTYFQVNEVFADDYSSQHPIQVPRKFLWPLRKRIVHFGTSTSAILKGESMGAIHYCFWNGFICVRGIDRKTGAPRPLSRIFHIFTTNKEGKAKKDEKAPKRGKKKNDEAREQ